MPEYLDGNTPLADQESAIQFKEAKGFELVSLKASEDQGPANEVEFKRLPIGHRPKRIKLIEGESTEEGVVWSGEIYVEGSKQKAYAKRL